MSDRFGRPWFMYRAREGYLGQKLNKKKDMDYALGMGRHTGILRPPALPRGPFMNHQPWHLRVLEPDIMMGRRGVLGWDGLDHNKGLMVNGGVAPSWWDDVMDWWDDLDHTERWIYGTIGIAAAAALSMATFGTIWIPAIGAGVFSASLGAYEWGGFRMDAYGPKDTAGRMWQAFGTVGMKLGAMGVAMPFMHAGVLGLIKGASAISPVLGFGVKAGVYGLAAYGLANKGLAMYRDFGADDVDWIEWTRRHGATAVIMGAAAGYGAYRGIRWAAPRVVAGARRLPWWLERRGLLGSRGYVKYGKLDAGRYATGAKARVTQAMLGTGTRARQSIRPPGFEGGDVGHSRGHLIAKVLGGSGDVPENLVTLFQRPANTPAMSHFEGQIAKAVSGGDIVKMIVTPVYSGGTPLPVAGVTIQAQGRSGLDIWVSIMNRSKAL